MPTNMPAVVLAGLTVIMAGCTTTPEMTLREGHGDAVRTNTALQVVNPDAGKEKQPPQSVDGQKAEKTLEDYRKESGELESGRLVEDVGTGTSQ